MLYYYIFVVTPVACFLILLILLKHAEIAKSEKSTRFLTREIVWKRYTLPVIDCTFYITMSLIPIINICVVLSTLHSLIRNSYKDTRIEEELRFTFHDKLKKFLDTPLFKL